jgi:hypothetical protein
LYVFAFHTAIDQKDIQEVQNDFCKFLMQEVLCESSYFYYYNLEYRTDPKFEALRDTAK